MPGKKCQLLIIAGTMWRISNTLILQRAPTEQFRRRWRRSHGHKDSVSRRWPTVCRQTFCTCRLHLPAVTAACNGSLSAGHAVTFPAFAFASSKLCCLVTEACECTTCTESLYQWFSTCGPPAKLWPAALWNVASVAVHETSNKWAIRCHYQSITTVISN